MPFVKSVNSRILKARDSYWPPNIRGGADVEAFKQWQRELKAARQRFLDDPPLRDAKQYTLTVSVPSIAQDSYSRRALPACAAGNGDVTVTLRAPLAGSPLGGELSKLPGRVWRATTPAGEDVVVKFYYPSLFIPKKPHAPLEKDGDFVLPRQYGLAEELAYDILRSAQGRWLPYFLGRTEVSLSNGEIADVALFECIPGRKLRATRR
ncbi:hypothetical protein PENSPDRAFT_237219 [Peniophora sp. CONT]|nr:hypothetical protein PENSPDRAFT_237219 [Peniophora sp. CONT]